MAIGMLESSASTRETGELVYPSRRCRCWAQTLNSAFGASSTPASGYSADRLGDDVLAVLDALTLNRPVLAGHSLGGEEMSSVATRHPERIAGLVYLDAAYAYAYYDRSRGDLSIDSLELQRKLEQLRQQRPGMKQVIQELLEQTIP